MQFASCLCLVVVLSVVHISHQIPLKHEDGDFNIMEVDPSELENLNWEESEEPIQYATAVVRNKRDYGYGSDYSSEQYSDEVTNNFPYYRPTSHHVFRPYWNQNGYGFWRPAPVSYHGRPSYKHHHDKNCKYPDDHSNEYGDLDIKNKYMPEAPVRVSTTPPNVIMTTQETIPSVPPTVGPISSSQTPIETMSTSTSTSSTTTTEAMSTSTTTSSTTTTEDGPPIDIRSSD